MKTLFLTIAALFVAGSVRVAAQQSGWELVAAPVANGKPVVATGISATPSGALFLVASGEGLLYRSLTMGKTWEPAGTGIVPDHLRQARVLASPSGTLFLQSPVGTIIYRSINNGSDWSPSLELPKGGGQLYDLAFTSQGVIYATTDGAKMYRSSDDGKTWQMMDAPIVSPLVSATTNGDVVMATTNDSLKAVALRSEGGTGTWKQTFTGAKNTTLDRLFLNPQTNILFIGVSNLKNGAFVDADIFCSVDFGVSWQLVNTGIPTSDRRIASHIVTPDGNLHILVAGKAILTLPFARAEWEQRISISGITEPKHLANIGHQWFIATAAGEIYQKDLNPSGVEMEGVGEKLPLDLW